jgi:hypothetical protein
MKLKALLESRSVIVAGKKPTSFPDYVGSEQQLLAAIKDHGGTQISVDAIVQLFAKHNFIVSDNVQLDVPTEQVYKYREYDRETKDGFTGTNTQEQYEKIKQDIQDSGIKEPLMLRLGRKRGDGTVHVYLGEGNLRLRIARELKIKQVPLRFYYIK